MPMYILIRQLPGTDDVPGEIKANSKTYPTPAYAARAAAMGLAISIGLPKGETYRMALPRLRRPGVIWTHELGYRFRVLEADYTDDGRPIVPGLRVRNNDNWWGVVHGGQFLAVGSLDPGGLHFDHWYYVHREDDEMSGAKYNGERLSTRELAR